MARNTKRDREWHHPFYTGGSWESHEATRGIRRHPSLIVPMYLEPEASIHAQQPTVPLIDYITAQHALKAYRPDRTYTGSLERMAECIEQASNHPKSTDLQKRLASLTIEAIQFQIPIIRMGCVTNQIEKPYVAH